MPYISSPVWHILLGYLSGSVLYANVCFHLFHKENALAESKDGNPGTANAFALGGFWCGTLTLLGDLLKGFLPVFLFLTCRPSQNAGAFLRALTLAAPVIGHAFPLLYRFKGGKCIAVTFGCLLGLLPMWQPAALLACAFLFFSLVLRVTPHFHRTLAAFLCTALLMPRAAKLPFISVGFLLITATVCIRMFTSREEKERMRVKLLWMR